ncbi:hypothetical protein HGRIS_014339 [Hohenbuehelia grisea]|uniref:Heterokaryon incompatibility domain-containing protein n=1 Tax=Hohenbuehelia grisea TaxID=104357 RepID=A0ABR3JU41_9AGAR
MLHPLFPGKGGLNGSSSCCLVGALGLTASGPQLDSGANQSTLRLLDISHCGHLANLFEPLQRFLSTIIRYRMSTRPSSACHHCWNTLLGPRGWLVPALALSKLERPAQPVIHRYNRRRGQMRSSAGSGCSWCSFVFNDDKAQAQTDSDMILVVISVQMVWNEGESPEQLLGVDVHYDGTTSDMLSCFFYAEHDSPTADFVAARSEIHDVASPLALDEAKKCIAHCIHHHEDCPPPPHDPELPARVVDCQDPAHPKLASAQPNTMMRGAYIALSYVWGEAQPHSTTTANLAHYHKNIDPAWLPQTVRDAIVITHAFGVRYLWLDTLCIIQDSDEDKVQQLAQMARIYSEAYFTIVVANASRVSHGFLEPRSAPRIPGPSLQVWCPATAQLGTVQIGYELIHCDKETKAQIYAADNDPIHARGWCLQERFLSPRSLEYTSRTLRFHCQMRSRNVGGSRFQSNRFSESQLTISLFNPNPFAETDGTFPGLSSKTFLADPERRRYAHAVLHLWKSILKEYTKRSITHPSDKLLALAGVVERFYKLRNSKYYAGIWEDTLLTDLLWTSVTERGSQPAQYRAPTWSWAALDNQVDIPSTTTYTESVGCEIVRCDVVLASELVPFGGVTSARLLLDAPIVRVFARTVEVDQPRAIFAASDSSRERKLFLIDEDIDRTRRSALDTPDQICIGDAIFDRIDRIDIDNLWAVPILWDTSSEGTLGADERFVWAEGLITTLDERAEHQRVGRWSVSRSISDTSGEGSAGAARESETMSLTWIDEVSKSRVCLV